MERYKHLFFDLDRTLWDFDTNSTMALSEIYVDFDLQSKGVPTLDEFLEVYKKINSRLWGQYRMGALNKRKLRTFRFTKTLAHFGCLDEYLGDQIGTAYIKISPYKTVLLPNCTEVLDYLQGRYALHIITNGFEEVQHVKLEQSGLTKYFETVLTSEQASARKPDPRVFAHAFKLAGTRADDSIMIGDDLRTDIQGAINVEMDHVYFNPHQKCHDQTPTYEIADLIELKNFL